MNATETDTGTPEARLREAEKQITIAKDALDDDDEFQTDLEAAGSIVAIVANSLAVEDADPEITGGET